MGNIESKRRLIEDSRLGNKVNERCFFRRKQSNLRNRNKKGKQSLSQGQFKWGNLSKRNK